MKFSASLNTVSRAREGALTAGEGFELIKNAGFEAAEIDLSRGEGAKALAAEAWREALAEIKEKAGGLPIVSVHAPHDPRLYMPDIAPSAEQRAKFDMLLFRSAEAAHILGAEILVVHPVDNMIDAEYDRAVNLETNKKYLAEVVREAKKYGIKVAVENVYYSSEYRLRRRFGESAEEVALLADELGVGVCYNCGHAHPVTMEQGRAIEKLGKRIILMHISDSRGHTDAGLPPMLGGNIKWERIMPSVAKIGFEGYAVLQADRYLTNLPKELCPEALGLAKTMCDRLGELCV